MSYSTNSPVFDYPYSPHERDWPAHPALATMKLRFDAESKLFFNLLDKFSSLDDLLSSIPVNGDANNIDPFWNNIWFPPLDAISLCGILKEYCPNNYIEVGSGNSTKFARWTVDNLKLKTKITSIEPYPRDNMNLLAHNVICNRMEDVDQSVFHNLGAGDIIFIDNSHRSFMGSDVTVFFLEVLPLLKKGVIVGIHDIFLPFDYPDPWKERFYNEQYLLASYITGGFGGGYTLFPVHYIGRFHSDKCQKAFPKLGAMGVHATGGGAFFFSR